MKNEYTKIFVWAAVVGGLFFFLWKKGYLLRIRDYVLETREELRKCSWPTVEELKGSTLVVMLTIALIGGFTVSVDWVLNLVMKWVNS